MILVKGLLRLAEDKSGRHKMQLFDVPNEVSDFPLPKRLHLVSSADGARFWYMSWTIFIPSLYCNTELSALDFRM